MKILEQLHCCGGGELIGFNDTIWTPESQLRAYLENTSDLYDRDEGFSWLVFSYAWYKNSTATSGDKGTMSHYQGKQRLTKWKKYIEDNGLGVVTLSPRSNTNPHMGHSTRIRCGIWIPANKAIRQFAIDHKWADPGKYEHLNHWGDPLAED